MNFMNANEMELRKDVLYELLIVNDYLKIIQDDLNINETEYKNKISNLQIKLKSFINGELLKLMTVNEFALNKLTGENWFDASKILLSN